MDAARLSAALAAALLASSVLLCLQGAAAQAQMQGEAPVDPFAAPADAASAAGNGGAFGRASTPEEERLKYRGIATVAFDPQPLDKPYGALPLGCGLAHISPLFQANYVGVGPSLFSDGFACGRCVTLQCDDESCASPGNRSAQVALVADQCGSCTKADLSVSGPLFRNLTGRDPGANPSIVMSWDITPCAPYTDGSIRMLVKEGGSAYYQALALSNAAQPITAVQVNGQPLAHSSDNSWQWNPGKPIDPTAPLQVDLLGGNRERLRARLPTLGSADLGVQFKA